MAEEKKLPVPAPAPEAVPLHRPEVDAAPLRGAAVRPAPMGGRAAPPRRWALPRQRVHITG